MIRFLECQAAIADGEIEDRPSGRDGYRIAHGAGRCAGSRYPPRKHDLDVTPAIYLRAAHAYMLISMPTGTSTIFGAFQAIVPLHSLTGTVIVLSIKLPRREKFASGIFLFWTVASIYCSAEAAGAAFAAQSRENNEFVMDGFATSRCSRPYPVKHGRRIKHL
jgi:hypothetical protein